MILTIAGKVGLRIENIRPDTAVEGSKMRAADLVGGDVITPCITHGVAYGNIEMLNTEWAGNISIMIFDRTRHTAHTRKGFVDVQITTKPVQFCAYIHTDHLERFLTTFSMLAVRAGLKI